VLRQHGQRALKKSPNSMSRPSDSDHDGRNGQEHERYRHTRATRGCDAGVGVARAVAVEDQEEHPEAVQRRDEHAAVSSTYA